MAKDNSIPRPTIERLPLYLYTLRIFQGAGVEVVSSKKLGEAMDLKAVQIRKDLTYFGEFGQRGVGYEVDALIYQLNKILGIGREQQIVLVGAGHIGSALVNYEGFKEKGFNIVAAFDVSSQKIGTKIGDITVRPLKELEVFVQNNDIKMGIITVPSNQAQAIANRLIDQGVKAIWNFAPITIHVPKDVCCYQQNLSVGLLTLSFYLNYQKQ